MTSLAPALVPTPAGLPANAPVTLVSPGTNALAYWWTSIAGTTLAANPATTDGSGVLPARYADPGHYDMVAGSARFRVEVGVSSDLIALGITPEELPSGGAVASVNGQVGAVDLTGIYSQALLATAVKTAPYAAVPKDYVLTDLTGGSVSHSLPVAPPDGTRIGYKIVAISGSNVLTFTCGGSDHINLTTGPTSGTLSKLNQAVILQYAAATAVWTVQSSDLPLSVVLGLPLALTGATAATRYAGGTATGAPTTGTFAVGDYVVDQTGKVWVCTVAGTPGTWVQAAGGGGGVDSTAIHQTGNESAAGTKTLTSADGLVLGVQGTTLPRLTLATMAATANWTLNSRAVTFSGVVDHTLTIGFNHTTGQTKQDAALVQWALQIEATYQPPAGEKQSEFILAYTSADGATSLRPWSIVTTHTTHTSEHSLCGRINWFSHNGLTLHGSYNPVGPITGSPEFNLASGTQFVINDFIIKRTSAGILAFGSASAIAFNIGIAGQAHVVAGGTQLMLFGLPSSGGVRSRTKFTVGEAYGGDRAAGDVALTVEGTAGQTAELLLIKSSAPANLWSITAAGVPRWNAAGNVQATVGAAGAASALPATPSKYLKVVGDDGVTYVVPAYAAA
jgi:hypothetical protein